MLGLAIVAAVVAIYESIGHRLRSTPLTGPLVLVIVGLVLSSKGLGLVQLDLDATTAQILLKSTLVILLFTEASEMKARVLREEASLTTRLLGIAMPAVIVLGTVAGATLLGVLSIWEAAVLGVLLAPTDAALGQPVVSNPDVPGPVRRSLIVEAGLNDGLAVPFAFAFAAAGEIFAAETTAADGILFLVQQVGIGVVVGAAIGWLGGKGLLTASQRGLATSTAIEIAFLALAGVSFAAAEWLHGNGFISAWVAGLLFAVATEHQLEARAFAMRAGDLLTLLSFFLFGVAVLPVTLDRIEGAWILYALASLVLIRPIAVSLSMLGSRLRFPTIAYLGWFGPRGIASLILVLLVEKQFDLAGIETVIDVVTVTVALSVVLHGTTAWRGSEMYAEWIQRHGLGPLKRYERPESSGNA